MTEIPMSLDLYYNTQIYFAKNILPTLPYNDKEWAIGYKNWLMDQGCGIKSHPQGLLVNTLGVSPGFDTFTFQRDEDAVEFVLKWG